MTETFDVFLSHNSKDKPVVRQIAARLEDDYGVTSWLDVDALRPGLPFQDGLQKAILETPAAAVFVGNHGQGPWQRVEVCACLSQMVRHGKPVIPVLLEGAPDEPDIGLFLAENTWVDLRGGMTEEGLDRLVYGITGKKPKRRKKPAAAGGLEGVPEPTRHFQERKHEEEACLKALRTGRLVTIVGLPGAGKTELSLVVAQKALADPALQPQRVLWFSLAGVRSVEEVAGRLALAFEVGATERIEALFKAIDQQRVLLLLDNAEDLIGEALIGEALPDFQRFCGELLRHCTGVKLLLTSRRGLGDVPGCEEKQILVGRLPQELALNVFRSAATRLSPAELESPELEALVAALDGHPLSLVLVAGRAGRGMSLSTLLRRLEDNGDEAVIAREYMAETRPAPDEELRTKRLISSLNLSFKPLLSNHPPAAELFLWLGLFPAGLLSELVPLIFGESGEENMALLLDFNLAEMDGGPAARLLFPAPVRWYAKRRLSEVSAERQAALLTATFLNLGKLLETAAAQSSSERASQSLNLALREEPNLAALLPAALRATANGCELTEGIADTLVPWIYLISRADRPAVALELVRRSLVDGEDGRYRLHDLARVFAGSLTSEEERSVVERLHAVHYRDILAQADDLYKEGGPSLLVGLRLVDREWPNIQAAQAWAAARMKEDREAAELVASYSRIGAHSLPLRLRSRERIGWLETALEGARLLKDRYKQGYALGNLGLAYSDLGEIRRAIELYEQRLSIAREIGDRGGEANATGRDPSRH